MRPRYSGRVDVIDPALGPADVQPTGVEINLVPAQAAQFRGTKPMPIGNKDHGSVTVTVAGPLARRFLQPPRMLGQAPGRVFELPVNDPLPTGSATAASPVTPLKGGVTDVTPVRHRHLVSRDVDVTLRDGPYEFFPNAYRASI